MLSFSMIIRPAIVGLALAVVLIAALIMFSRSAGTPFFGGSQKTLSGEDLPPVLFPMFPEEGTESTENTVPTPRISVTKRPLEREVTPGSTVHYTITVENTGITSVRNVMIEERYDESELVIVDAPGSTIGQNRMSWQVPLLGTEQSWSARYTMKIDPHAPIGSIETTTYVLSDDLLDTPSGSRMITSALTIIALPPTGAELNWFLRLLSTARYTLF